MKSEFVVYPYTRVITEMFVGCAEFTDKRKIGDWHVHNELEFLCVTNGCLRSFSENDVICAKKGDVIFTNNRVPHVHETVEVGTTYVILHFSNPSQLSDSLKYLVKYLAKTNYPRRIFRNGDADTTYISTKIMEIFQASQYQDHVHDYLMIAKKYELVSFMLQNNFIADESNLIDNKTIKSISNILDYLHDNYQHPLTLNDISNALHLHGNYICRLFKKATGVTVIDYLNYIRISKAEELLKNGVSIAQASELTGFSSPSYFNKVFKKYFILSPSTYKNQTK